MFTKMPRHMDSCLHTRLPTHPTRDVSSPSLSYQALTTAPTENVITFRGRSSATQTICHPLALWKCHESMFEQLVSVQQATGTSTICQPATSDG